MRTLKYRAYIKPLKRYAEKYETILYHHQCNMEPSWTVNISPEEYYGDEDLVIEQFTGLLDRNGKEIYEGDIITETIDDSGYKIIQIYEVYWDEDMLNFGIRGTKDFNYNLHDELWETNASREVIGNVHENPELLESKE